MDGGAQYNLRTVEEVFRDFKGRRAGMIKALTTGPFSFLFFPSILLFSFNYEFQVDDLGFFCGFCSFFVLLLIILLYFFSVFPDVEEFYHQCDPGKGFAISLSFSFLAQHF